MRAGHTCSNGASVGCGLCGRMFYTFDEARACFYRDANFCKIQRFCLQENKDIEGSLVGHSFGCGVCGTMFELKQFCHRFFTNILNLTLLSDSTEILLSQEENEDTGQLLT